VTATPWTKASARAARPVRPVGERRYGWADRVARAGRPRHAGIGTREEVERGAEEMDRHEQAPADRHDSGTADRHDFGTADRHDFGTADRHDSGIGTAPARPIGTPDRHDIGTGEWHNDHADADADADADAATHHHIVMPDDERRADVVRTGSADADADADADEAGPARQRYPLISSLRFWNEEIRLGDLLRIVRQGDYNLSHILVVRAANVTFFWLVTAPFVTAAFCFMWAFAVSLHRALTIAAVVLVAAQAVPIVSWLVVSTWSAATWQWIGAAALVFGVGTAIAVAAERRR